MAPFEPSWTKAFYHLYVIRVEDRDGFMRQMTGAAIGTAIHYPVPLHLQKAYAGLEYRAGEFPVTEKVSSEIVSLPMFPGLTTEQQKRVVETIREFKRTAQPTTEAAVALASH
jgi:dTDP-4-amino-4,6-dideoxygalactose transaminase